MDLSKMDIRRFGRQYRSRDYALAKAYEIYAKHYDVRYPGEENDARAARSGWPPTYARLEKLDAEFGEKAGWERANWFRFERGSCARGTPAARLGRRAVVHRDRRRAPRHPGTGRAVRRDELREVRGLGPGRIGPAAAPVRERRRRARRPRRLHADVEPPRRDRIGSHGHTSRPRSVPARDGNRLREQRPRVDPEAPGGLGRGRPGRHVEPRLLGDLGSGGTRDPDGGLRRRPFERSLPAT